MTLEAEIRKLAKEKNAIIIAHNYQPAEIQDIAHFTGDSLELSRLAANNDADVIVFCGVHFMAESANLLSPQKTVLLPEINAGCPMADMAQGADVLEMKKNHPDAKVVTYINSTAEVKALSDACCTSSNAVKIVQRIDAQKIIFIPDKNLGSWVSKFTDKEIILWDGFCPTHFKITKEDIVAVRNAHPDALLIMHPECSPDVVALADEVLSTGGMVDFVSKTSAKKIIVATENGMIHKLRKTAPQIEYIPVHENFICPNMKKITLEKVRDALLYNKYVIRVNEDVAVKARKALTVMLELSK